MLGQALGPRMGFYSVAGEWMSICSNVIMPFAYDSEGCGADCSVKQQLLPLRSFRYVERAVARSAARRRQKRPSMDLAYDYSTAVDVFR